MRIRRTALLMTLFASITTVKADVTLTQQLEGTASVLDVSGETVTKIKGNRQRTEQALKGKTNVAIIDVDGRRFIGIDDRKQTAYVTPLAILGDTLKKGGSSEFQATLTKTSVTKTVASYPCTVYDVSITLPFNPTGDAGNGLDLTLQTSGTVCLSTAAPGYAEYRSFYLAAADSGFIFGDPRTANTPTGAAQARSYAALTRKMAEAGIPLETQIMTSAGGGGGMGNMLGKLASSNIHSTVTSIVIGDLPAESFEIPAGYKVKTEK